MKQYETTVHEFGKQNPDVIVMFHPLGVWWDVFDRVIPILERRFHLVIPAVPGLDPDRPEQTFTSIEEIEERIETWLVGHGHQAVQFSFACLRLRLGLHLEYNPKTQKVKRVFGK